MASLQSTPRKCVPEEFTHLYHTSCYAQLSEAQRVRYNILFGLRINEQFIQFEELFIKALMPRLKLNNSLKTNPRLLAGIESILRDEERHSRMFARINRSIRPDLYHQTDNPLTCLSAMEQGLLKLLLQTPGLLPALVWLLLAMEELTTAISSTLLHHPAAAELNQDYLAVHRVHLQDEKRHVGIDRKMLLCLLERLPSPVRKLNALLFRKTFRSILTPRRSTVRVIQQLLREEPGLETQGRKMMQEVTSLPLPLAFPANLITRKRLPVLYDLFERYPEYRPAAVAMTSTP